MKLLFGIHHLRSEVCSPNVAENGVESCWWKFPMLRQWSRHSRRWWMKRYRRALGEHLAGNQVKRLLFKSGLMVRPDRSQRRPGVAALERRIRSRIHELLPPVRKVRHRTGCLQKPVHVPLGLYSTSKLHEKPNCRSRVQLSFAAIGPKSWYHG